MLQRDERFKSGGKMKALRILSLKRILIVNTMKRKGKMTMRRMKKVNTTIANAK